MRIKTIILTGLTIATINVPTLSFARTTICPYNDFFTITAPVGVKIVSAKTVGSITYIQRGDTAFTLGCGDSRSDGGDVYLTVGNGTDSKCTLKVHDGPYAMNPSVSVTECTGLNFKDSHHHTGSYTYDLTFTA